LFFTIPPYLSHRNFSGGGTEGVGSSRQRRKRLFPLAYLAKGGEDFLFPPRGGLGGIGRY